MTTRGGFRERRQPPRVLLMTSPKVWGGPCRPCNSSSAVSTRAYSVPGPLQLVCFSGFGGPDFAPPALMAASVHMYWAESFAMLMTVVTATGERCFIYRPISANVSPGRPTNAICPTRVAQTSRGMAGRTPLVECSLVPPPSANARIVIQVARLLHLSGELCNGGSRAGQGSVPCVTTHPAQDCSQAAAPGAGRRPPHG
jgi:hypothetical protein